LKPYIRAPKSWARVSIDYFRTNWYWSYISEKWWFNIFFSGFLLQSFHKDTEEGQSCEIHTYRFTYCQQWSPSFYPKTPMPCKLRGTKIQSRNWRAR
jgi:hypothetical protein